MLRSLSRRLKGHVAPVVSAVYAPVVRGPLRGSRWSIGSRGKLARVLLGTYEPSMTRWFMETVSAGDSIFDVGANVGYYAVLAARLVGEHGRVVAIEPAPTNLYSLDNNLRINRLGNVMVFRGAAGDSNGVVRFECGGGTGTGRVSETGTLEVPMRRLDDLVAAYNVQPAAIKIDVEGAELRVLRGASRLLSTLKPALFVSTHGQVNHEECLRVLHDFGYGVVDVDMKDPRAGGDVRLSASGHGCSSIA